jgi:hypothetical protein
MPSHAVGLQTAEFSLNERREATVLPPSLWPKRVATKPGCRQFLDLFTQRGMRLSVGRLGYLASIYIQIGGKV